ncbi:hypothetical protein [Xylella fastidiosa]|uniref:hypothetical protein n=1 Tax=Xylella fastidiosa TaxID=2371 RepID=UPI003AFA84D7
MHHQGHRGPTEGQSPVQVPSLGALHRHAMVLAAATLNITTLKRGLPRCRLLGDLIAGHNGELALTRCRGRPRQSRHGTAGAGSMAG